MTREDVLVAELKRAYTLLVSAEPAIGRDARRPGSHPLNAQLHAMTDAWLADYRERFDDRVAELLAVENAP